MDEVVAADRQRVAVAGDHPHAQLRPRHLQAGGDGGGAAVDAMEPVRIHVIGEAAGAADAADEDDLLPRQPQLGHQLLHRGEDGEVAAPRAPAHFLIGDEVLLAERKRRSHRPSLGAATAAPSALAPDPPGLRASDSMVDRTSATWKGLPWTLLRPIDSRPRWPRRGRRSRPRVTSRTSTPRL